MSETSARVADMHPRKKLVVIRCDDGDVVVSIHDEDGLIGFGDSDHTASVEFCVSGGHSPKTRLALIALFAAMKEDESVRPQKP